MSLDSELLDTAGKGDVRKVRELLDRGADVNARDEDGVTPLHYAAYYGFLDAARLLLDRGADVNARDEFGGTPLHYAAGSGHVNVVRLLLDRGADVNARDEDGVTPLHYAAYYGFLDAARLLLDRGADVNARAKYGVTPLYLAAREGHVDVARLLLERGADAGARDDKGRTPLDRAREKGHVEVARVIEEYGRGKAGAREVKAGGLETATAAEPGAAGAPSILGVEYSSLYAGEWGRLLVKVKGAGLASLVVEGGVEWLDPGCVMLSGESVVEVPVKPGAAGELPVRITVKSKGGEDARIAWLKVSEKARKCPSCGAPVEPGAKYCWKCGAKLV